LQGGLDAVLVREKQLSSAKLLALASRLREITRIHQARLIIHSQADIAKAVDADGVHLAGSDIPAAPSLRQWLGHDPMSISVSCHSAEELDQAAAQAADWAMLSPVFPTRSHPGAPHLGLAKFEQLAEQAALPVVALGGIHAGNVGTLAGRPIAVIGAILDAADPQQAARLLSGSQAT